MVFYLESTYKVNELDQSEMSSLFTCWATWPLLAPPRHSTIKPLMYWGGKEIFI